MIKRSFRTYRPRDFTFLLGTNMRHLLEYTSSITFSGLTRDADLTEKGHRKATNLVHGMHHLQYDERVRRFKLHLVDTRRIGGDILLAHYLIENNVGELINCANHPILRGHSHKLSKQSSRTRVMHNFFFVRIEIIWNNLPTAYL